MKRWYSLRYGNALRVVTPVRVAHDLDTYRGWIRVPPQKLNELNLSIGAYVWPSPRKQCQCELESSGRLTKAEEDSDWHASGALRSRSSWCPRKAAVAYAAAYLGGSVQKACDLVGLSRAQHSFVGEPTPADM